MAKTLQTKLYLALAFMLALFVLFAAPDVAHAKSYSLTSTKIEATVNDDCSMDVTQTRTVDFDGSFVLLMIPLGDDTDVEVKSVSVALGGNSASTLPEIEFDTYWRRDSNPSYASWSLDTYDNTLYVFANYDNVEATVEVNYQYPSAITMYRDVAELYWQFVPSSWEMDSENVTCEVTLPAPSGAAIGSEDIRAWGHGTLSGEVTNNADGKVTFVVDSVEAGTYAEARIVFPTTWLDSVAQNYANEFSYDALDSILAEEQQWADEANRQRALQASVVFISIGGLIVGLLIIVLLWWKVGKEYKPTFTDDYWRDAPEKGVHPAVISRLMSWNSPDQNELATSIMWLSQKGLISISGTTQTEKTLLGSRQVTDYLVKKNSATDDLDPISKAAMSLLFDTVAEGKDQLLFSQINTYAGENSEEFRESYDAWQTQVEMATVNQQYFEEKAEMWSHIYLTAGFIMFIAAFICVGLLQNLIPLITCIVLAIVLVVFSRFMRRRTQKGADTYAKSKALKKWLCEFSTLDERPPTDVKVWGEFMVYAFALGVAKEAIKQLKISVPELFESTTLNTVGSDLPWWFWYTSFDHSYGGVTSSFMSGTDFLQTTMDNTWASIKSAEQAMRNIGGGGGFSSGGGFGGGFSGGGGGGFGGGGFGGAR